MNRKEIFLEGEFYHLYNRGNSKQLIFLNDEDRKRFVKLLYISNSTKPINFREDIVKKKMDVWDVDRGQPLVSIGAWTLMPNHFHLLVTIPKLEHNFISPKSDFGHFGQEKRNAVSVFMQKVFTAYSKYFNAKHERTGALFECNFKSSAADNDRYLKYLFSYIHLNPIKLIDKNWKENGIQDIEKAKNFLESYKWSSYQDYLGKERIEDKVLSRKDFPDYFDSVNVFEDEVFEWLSFDPVQTLL